jgi:hypothetical protein
LIAVTINFPEVLLQVDGKAGFALSRSVAVLPQQKAESIAA